MPGVITTVVPSRRPSVVVTMQMWAELLKDHGGSVTTDQVRAYVARLEDQLEQRTRAALAAGQMSLPLAGGG